MECVVCDPVVQTIISQRANLQPTRITVSAPSLNTLRTHLKTELFHGFLKRDLLMYRDLKVTLLMSRY